MKKQAKSFLCAVRGIFSAIGTESHLRFHLVAAFYVVFFALLGEFDPSQWAILSVTIGTVIFAELVNTALEDLCDLYTKEYNEKIKRIKDVAAGAVFVTAIASVFVAVCLFILTGNICVIFSKLWSNPLWFIPLGASAVLSLLFLFLPVRKNKKDKE